MFSKSHSLSRIMEIDCFSCFGFIKKPEKKPPIPTSTSTECLLIDDDDHHFQENLIYNRRDSDLEICAKTYEEIYSLRAANGTICREIPVKESRLLVRTEDADGNKVVNDYIRECKIGSGSYGKVVRYRSKRDGKQYAMKVFHKSHLLKIRVTSSETAMTDVLREVSIMKMVCHPNIVNLVEVIDDPGRDQFYMVLEYVEGKCASGLATARRYLRDIVAGLMYLHDHNVVHGDIKPENLLVTSDGRVKIGDFSVSQIFEDVKDELRRTPGTPVFTAPECCTGLTYHGKGADIWALGVTLYWLVLGQYPFLGETFEDTYDRIVNDPLSIPEENDARLKNLLEGILCKDPEHRMSLEDVARHPWVVDDEGLIPHYRCFCKRGQGSLE